MSRQVRLYLDLVRRRCGPQAEQWWDSVLPVHSADVFRDELSRAYARAGRLLGNSPLKLEPDEASVDETSGLMPFEGRPVHELGRTALLLFAIEALQPEVHVEFIDELFVRGDNAERETLLRALAMLPEAGRFLATAVGACRTNVQTVFESIACENPYPAHYFPELNFNQLVMKALFIGLSLRRIVGLSERISPALRQKVADYVKERRAAGRPAHEDTALILNH